MKFFISAGEPSGDLHGSTLVHALRRRFPNARFHGFGGPRMHQAGVDLLYPLVHLSVMWFLRVLANLHIFIRLLVRADRFFREERPDVVVLIDYPGFHWWVARRAKARGIPVVYYVPPQLWAWAGWRVEKMKRFVDLVLCSLPFEVGWYRDRGMERAEYVGHPYFDELSERTLDNELLELQRSDDRPRLAILPGSRTQEIVRNLPMMLRAAERLAKVRPDVRFAVACLHDSHRQRVLGQIEQQGLAGLGIEVFAGKTPEILRLADCAWAVSGSVSLELLHEALPSVIVYRVNRFDLWLARPFIKTPFICLVNLLAQKVVMPEFLTGRDVSPELARQARLWLDHPEERRKASAILAKIRQQVAIPGASERAADQIAAVLGREATIYRGVHRTPSATREPSIPPAA